MNTLRLTNHLFIESLELRVVPPITFIGNRYSPNFKYLDPLRTFWVEVLVTIVVRETKRQNDKGTEVRTDR